MPNQNNIPINPIETWVIKGESKGDILRFVEKKKTY